MRNIIEVDREFNATYEAVKGIKVGDRLYRAGCGGCVNEVVEVGELRTIEIGGRTGKIFRLVTFRTSPTSQTSTTICER